MKWIKDEIKNRLITLVNRQRTLSHHLRIAESINPDIKNEMPYRRIHYRNLNAQAKILILKELFGVGQKNRSKRIDWVLKIQFGVFETVEINLVFWQILKLVHFPKISCFNMYHLLRFRQPKLGKVTAFLKFSTPWINSDYCFFLYVIPFSNFELQSDLRKNVEFKKSKKDYFSKSGLNELKI